MTARQKGRRPSLLKVGKPLCEGVEDAQRQASGMSESLPMSRRALEHRLAWVGQKFELISDGSALMFKPCNLEVLDCKL